MVLLTVCSACPTQLANMGKKGKGTGSFGGSLALLGGSCLIISCSEQYFYQA